MRASLLALALALAGTAGLLAPGARADTLLLRGGGHLEGDVREDGAQVEVRLPNGAIVHVARADVLEVVLGDTSRDEYLRRINHIDRTDAEGLYRLGLFCKDHALEQEALAAFRLAVLAVPDHEGARAALDEVRYDGAWMPRAEAMERQGLVRWGRKWVTREEKARLEWAERAKVCAAEVRRLSLRVRSPDPDTRAAAARALSSLDDPAALDALSEAAGHWHADVRFAVVPALARRAPEAEARVSQRLADIASRDPDLDVQDLAADEIRARRLAPAAEALLAAYVDSDESSVRKAAAHALGRIRYKPAFGTLLDTLYFSVLRRKLIPVFQIGSTLSADGPYIRRRALHAYDLCVADYRVVDDTAFNTGALDGLRGLTGVDYDYDRTGWWRWWTAREAGFDTWMEAVPGAAVVGGSRGEN